MGDDGCVSAELNGLRAADLRKHVDDAVHHAGGEFLHQVASLFHIKPGDAEKNFVVVAAQLVLNGFQQHCRRGGNTVLD